MLVSAGRNRPAYSIWIGLRVVVGVNSCTCTINLSSVLYEGVVMEGSLNDASVVYGTTVCCCGMMEKGTGVRTEKHTNESIL